MLFHTVPFFFLSMVAQKTSKLRYSDWLLRNFNQSESGYLSYHGEQNGGHHAKEHWKLSWKLVSKNSLHFVGSHHSEKQTVGSCIKWHWPPTWHTAWIASALSSEASTCTRFRDKYFKRNSFLILRLFSRSWGRSVCWMIRFIASVFDPTVTTGLEVTDWFKTGMGTNSLFVYLGKPAGNATNFVRY